MKHLKEQKEHQPLSKGKIIAICVVVGLVVAGGVFTTLFFINRVSGYREAKNYTDEILGTKDAVVAYLNRNTEDEKISEEDKKAFEDFKAAIEKAESYTENLGASKALKDKTVNEKYEAAKAEFDKLSTGLKVEGEMMKVLEDGEITSEEISELEKSDNDFLKTVAKDLTEYRNKVNEFNTTYADIKGKDKTKLDEDYAAITDAGLELKKKYSEIKFEDVYKMSRDDILGFYGTIEELNKFLAEKI